MAEAPEEPVERPEPSVVAAVLFVDLDTLAVSVQSVRTQVYEVGRMAVIGGGGEAATWAATHGVRHIPTLAEFVSGLDPSSDYVWIVHGDARPRPDALAALVAEAERNDASVVGSKILDGVDVDKLESVGGATDVFGEPYTGLDPDEVDLEQYDVVRDMAFVAGVSMLVRRDLFRGLGGIDPDLPPVSAGLDFSQRARIAGARVMVVPSAEVLHLRRCREDVASWQEQAGRMRAMMKAYRPVTLLWAVPMGWLVWLADAVARLFLGQGRPLGDLLLATGWNLARMRSTLRARRALSPVRATGDEELFRYQVSGSVRLRQLGTDLGTRFGWIIDQEPGVVSEEELEREVSAAGPVAAVLTFLVVALATRGLWIARAPGAGAWLPPYPDAGSVLASYAGGWNPAGLGSPEGLHPAAAVVAAVQWLLGGWTGAAQVVALLSLGFGVVGVARLLSRLGVGPAARFLAAIAYLLGPFALAFGEASYWPGLMALGPLPWLMDAVIAPPDHGRHLWGRVGRLVVSAAFVSALAPLAVLVPLAAVVLAGPLFSRSGLRVASLWWALVGVVAGADAIAAYLLGVPPSALFERSPLLDVWPSTVLVVALAVAALVAAVSARTDRGATSAWGGAMVAAALAVNALPLTGEAVTASVTLGSMGTALVVGGAMRIDLAERREAVFGQAVAAVAAVVVTASGLLQVPAGTGGMVEDRWVERLRFVESLQSDGAGERVLVVGAPESIPGDERVGAGYAWRLISAPGATLDQAWLASPRIGDRALAATLARIDLGASARPGAALAEFGIRWVVVSEDTPLSRSLRAQVDLAERSVEPGLSVFENLAYQPRVVTEGGPAWQAERIGAGGPASDARVRIADNADPGWGPEWQQDDWANTVSAAEGVASYRPDGLRRVLAWVSLAILVAASAVAVWGRHRR
jgi:hypothetical protein